MYTRYISLEVIDLCEEICCAAYLLVSFSTMNIDDEMKASELNCHYEKKRAY